MGITASLSGCDSSPASTTSTAGGSSAPAASSSGCPEGAFRDEGAGFCVELPSGFAKDKQETVANGTRFDFKGPNYGYFSVLVHKDPGKLKDEKELVEAAKKKPSDPTDVISDSQPTPQGDGVFRTINFRGGNTSQLDYVVLNGGRLLKCYTNASKDQIEQIVSTCKTVRGLSK